MQIRGNSIKYSSMKKRSSNNILSALHKRLKRLKENLKKTQISKPNMIYA